MISQTEFLALLKSKGYPEPVAVERAADYSLGEHAHDFDACALITNGTFEIAVDGKAAIYKAGEMFELARGTVHTERCMGEAVGYLSSRRV